GELGLHLQRGGFVDRGDLPEDVVGLLVHLRELQGGRFELVGASWNDAAEQQRDRRQQKRRLSHRSSIDGFASMLTSYPLRIFAYASLRARWRRSFSHYRTPWSRTAASCGAMAGVRSETRT